MHILIHKFSMNDIYLRLDTLTKKGVNIILQVLTNIKKYVASYFTF